MPQKLLKIAQQHFYPFFGSIWEKLSLKTSLIVISEMLGMLANTLTADDKYSLHNRETLLRPIQMQLSKKLFFFLKYLLHIWNLHTIWNILKKTWASPLIYFRNYRRQNALLLKCLKDPISEHPLSVNMLKEWKHCRNLHNGTFTLLLDQSQTNWVRKCISYLYLKS